ncbi:F5/8 type C domain-containing protein [bacterium A37T11]|nr:F5/8 type C domain-containing protein [bacterium A37T11]
MKTIYYTLITVSILISVSVSCKKMDNKYKEFVVPGGITYPGKAIDPKVYPGNNRIKISWLSGSDPKVTKARIFWNNYTDSVEIPVPAGQDTISYIFENLAENSYTFNIRTYDDLGNVSIPVEITGAVYGEQYQSDLLNIAILNAEVIASGKLKINWGEPDTTNGAIGTEVKYIKKNGTNDIKRFNFNTLTSEIDDYQIGSSFSYRTLYLPDSLAIDTFRTNFESYSEAKKINKSNWTITASSFEPTGQLPNGPPEKVIDDDDDTYWHSNHTTNITGYPYWLAIDMKVPVAVSRVDLTSRSNYYKEDFKQFRIEGSMDGQTWNDYGTYELPDQTGPQSFELISKPSMRYLRIWMINGVSVHAHLAEISVYGDFSK